MGAEIRVGALAPDEYEVVVDEGGSTSRHRVTIPRDATADWGLEAVDDEMLVRESFVFLLEREPKESIMATFALTTIVRYFPEYPEEIEQRLLRTRD